jgi:ATP/maltotriose-dependent transcriptional regulator MalT
MGNVSQFRLRVLVAPAGFGKTTLVQQWLDDQNTHYGWWTIDRMDDSPAVSSATLLRPCNGQPHWISMNLHYHQPAAVTHC